MLPDIEALYVSPPTPSPSPQPALHLNTTTGLAHLAPPPPSQHPHATPSPARRHYLASILHTCTPAELLFISSTLSPLLKRDFLAALPPELALHILGCIEAPRTLVRASMVSRRWRELAREESLWKDMSLAFGFLGIGKEPGELEEEGEEESDEDEDEPLEEMEEYADLPMDPALEWLTAAKRRARRERLGTQHPSSALSTSSTPTSNPERFSYRQHFKDSYITMMNWQKGGRLLRTHRFPSLSTTHPYPREAPGPASALGSTPQATFLPSTFPPLPGPTNINNGHPVPHHPNHPNFHHHHHHHQHHQHHNHHNQAQALPINAPPQAQGQGQGQGSPDTGVVTSLALDAEWVVVGLASSRIHVFSAKTGVLARTLVGHELGVWGVCLVSRSGVSAGRRQGNWEEGKVQRVRMQESGGGTEEGTTDDSESRSKKGKGRERRNRVSSNIGVLGRSTRPGVNIEDDSNAEIEPLDHRLPPNLRVALGLEEPEGDGEVDEGAGGELGYDVDLDVQGRSSKYDSRFKAKAKANTRSRDSAYPTSQSRTPTIRRPDIAPGPRSRSAANGASRTEAGVAYVPERMSDPGFASEGWGQPNALVVSGGCDKVVKVWDVKSGYCIYTLPGHTSTIRCMRVLHGRPIAVTGSRDGTVRVWDVQRGLALRVLGGHTGSVRCLDVNGRRVVSGSYDTDCRLWDIDTGECLFVLSGHFHQIYSIAFDGVRIVSGGLDTTVRIWDASTGTCTALLQGHTSLVCQIQLFPALQMLATGGSDGRVIVFSLETYLPLYSIAAHEASVTALQLDGRVLVTGGNDGRVRLFEVRTGRYIREMTVEGGECVWKVGFTGGGSGGTVAERTGRRRIGRGGGAGTCAIMGRRAGKTVMEIWSFSPRVGE